MTYSQKVKAGKEIVERMNSLSENGKFTFEYKNEIYQMRCYSVYEDGRKSFSVSKPTSVESMNVWDISRTSFELYTYNMMNQRSTYRMDMSLMKVITPKEV